MRPKLNFLASTQRSFSGRRKGLIRQTPYPWSSMVREASCFRAASPGQALGPLSALMEEWIVWSISRFWKKSFNWDSDDATTFSRTMTRNCAKVTKTWFDAKKVLQWSSYSPGLNPIENMWQDLKIAVYKRKPSNLAQLKQLCKNEWGKLPPPRRADLVESYPKRLQAVIAAKGAATTYWMCVRWRGQLFFQQHFCNSIFAVQFTFV